MWNSLEVAELIATMLGPFAIATSAVFINRRLKRVEQIQWRNRRIIDKRIEVYDLVAPLLNDLYCYLLWIGVWQRRTPPEIIEAKRQLDRTMNVHRYVLNETVFGAYKAFMAVTFQTFNRPGEDARIKTTLSDPLGDRRASRYFAWNPEWEGLFAPEKTAAKEEVKAAYQRLLDSFRESIGLS